MEIISIKVNDVNEITDSIACIGYFDGVHLGHQKLIKRVLEISKKEHLIPSVITFDRDPWVTIKGSKDLTHLTSNDDKYQLFEKFGIKRVFELAFTKEMANLSGEQFIELIKNQNIKGLVCGQDFTYGSYGKSHPDDLNKSIKTDVIEEAIYDDLKISSSLIENFIKFGDLDSCANCLGRAYEIKGKVTKGKQLGRTIGFKTANLALSFNYCLPRSGVYAGEVVVDGHTYVAMINVGNNPTFNYKKEKSVEAHILDFNRNIYGQDIIIIFKGFIRDERDFLTKEHLIKQLNEDRKVIGDYKGVW